MEWAALGAPAGPEAPGGVWGSRAAHALECDRKSLQKFTIFFH